MMHSRTRKALEHFADGPNVPPHGVGSVTIFDLIQRGWLVRSERIEDFGETLYSLTEAGRSALLSELSRNNQSPH